MPRVRESDMLLFRDIVSDVFACLGPLRACEEPIQQRCVEPIQEVIFDPFVDYCLDPVRHALAVNPLGWCPFCGVEPSLPQDDSPAEQDTRAAELQRARMRYQYNYSLVRTFHQGVQGKGIAILDSVPMEQLPSLCWVILVLQNALVVIDNLVLVLDMLAQPPRRQQRARNEAGTEEAVKSPEAYSDKDLTSVLLEDTTAEELRCEKERVEDLRQNLLGTLLWGQSIARRYPLPSEKTDLAEQPLTALAPPSEQVSTQTSSSWCPCPRCSPEAITRDLFENIKQKLGEIVERIMLIPALDKRPFSIKAYNDLFQRISLPQFAQWFQNDEMFALQRIAGQNPVVIERVEWTAELAARFPVTNEQYKEVMGADDSLLAASQDGRLYLCDYERSLGNVIGDDFPFDEQKYINAPLALFALRSDDRRVIKAVAIQCNPGPGDDNPVFTPPRDHNDPRYWNWEIAKTVVQNAECNDSEFYRHLGLGHLLTEAFILATYRQIPRAHPLYPLLTPNYVGTLYTNNTAVTSINEQGSYLNITAMIFAGTVDSTLGIAGNAVAGVNFTENMLPNNLAHRGVDDPLVFPNYPYRDDAKLIWYSINRFVDQYVHLYYHSDRDVTGDYELQSWVEELGSKRGGRIQGVGDGGVGGRIWTRSYLIDCLTEVIYTASAHHALTNFPLADYELYEPGWPGALYQPAPTSATGAKRRDWLAYLSKINIAILQQALGFTIGSTYFTKLGYYPICNFADCRVWGPILSFQEDLARIEEIINRRNEVRLLRYPYLLPSRIPASTNI